MSPRIQVLGIEVVQAIQSMVDPIELLAGKRTAVRVYLRPSGLATGIPVTAMLEVARDGRSEAVCSGSSIELQPDEDHPDLEAQRRSLERSLYFLLEPEQTAIGRVELRLKEVTPILRGDREIGLQVLDHDPVRADFKEGPSLSVRLVCYRVRDPATGDVHMPTTAHRLAVRSFLERAFPISELRWSEITVEPAPGFCPPYSDEGTTLADPGRAWQEKFDLACAHLLAIRARELEEDQDPETLYYGLVHHPTEFFVGAVSDVPPDARYDVVGIGPAEASDGSYAGHEIAHMLGRLHPGTGEGQTREDSHFPDDYGGRLSSAATRHHGFDVGDATHPPGVLPYDQWFDLMTYGEPLWVSAYTYRGLLKALRERDRVRKRKRAEFASKAEGKPYLHVIGTYELTRGAPKGRLAHVFPGGIAALAPAAKPGRVMVIGRDDAGRELFTSPIGLKQAAATDLGRDTGAFHVVVGNQAGLSALELVVDDIVVDVLEPGHRTREMPVLGKDLLTIERATDEWKPRLLTIAWPEAYSRRLTHTVQARKAGTGAPWRTVATGITAQTSQVPLERCELEPPVELRILRADRFGDELILEARLDLTPQAFAAPARGACCSPG